MYLMGLSQYLNWRKGWDSNPRTGSSPITRFRVERVTASSLPFHKRVLYTNCCRRASLFSHACRKRTSAIVERRFDGQPTAQTLKRESDAIM